MKISGKEKAELHEMLDYLLLAREGLERIDPSKLTPGMQYSLAWSWPRMELTINASKLVRRVLGQRLHEAELSGLVTTALQEDAKDTEALAILANALRSFEPLFSPIIKGEEKSEFIKNMIEDLLGVYWGDEPRFFSISPRWQGLHKRPYRLARLRLTALDWEKYLEAAGLSAFERQQIVSVAYRTRWDSIRKWKKSIAEQASCAD